MSIKFILIILTTYLTLCLCSTSCIWTYRCCEFKQNGLNIECVRMCEAQINCELTTTTESYEGDAENLESGESSVPKPLDLRYLRRNCKAGYRFVSGKCRMVMRLQDTHTDAQLD
ncbi:hypothetical protein ACKWTF_012968 [Chironomus riparius]